MHELADMDYDEDEYGRARVKWICSCRRTGSGRDLRAAQNGWKKHAQSAYRKEYG